MATAYTANVNVLYQDGFRDSLFCTGDDVNANNILGPDGLSPIRISAGHGNAAIVDVTISPTPASTRSATIRVNGLLVPYVLQFGANLATSTQGRQFQQNPLRLPAGASIQANQTT